MKTQHKEEKCQVHTKGRLRQQTARFLDFVLRIVVGKQREVSENGPVTVTRRKEGHVKKKTPNDNSSVSVTKFRRYDPPPFHLKTVKSPVPETSRSYAKVHKPSNPKKLCYLCKRHNYKTKSLAFCIEATNFSTGRVLQETLKCSFTFTV